MRKEGAADGDTHIRLSSVAPAKEFSTGPQFKFIACAFAVFFAVVYGIPVSDAGIVVLRSALLLSLAGVVFVVGRRIGISTVGFRDRPMGWTRILLWALTCYLANLVVPLLVYLATPHTVELANRRFYTRTLPLSPCR